MGWYDVKHIERQGRLHYSKRMDYGDLMDFENLKQYLLSKPEAIIDYPFGNDVMVLKVKGKMFALVGIMEWKGTPTTMLNLKCDPDESFIIRDVFPSITSGYHMNKKHWISVYFDGTVPDGEIERLIDNSYTLVVNKLPKLARVSLL